MSPEDPVNDKVPGIHDETFDLAYSPDVSLDAFMARPLIASYEWNGLSSLDTGFSPFRSMLNNPRIINRINNYAFIRGKVHVKVCVTGTAFHYGKAILAYEPWPLQTVNAPYPIQITQLPHIDIDPSVGEAGSMEYDILHPYNSFSLTEETGQGMPDWVFLRELTPLRRVGTGTGTVRIVIYYWMTDVVLQCPTEVNSTFLLEQSGEMSSLPRVSTAINAVIPYIGRYAKATEMILSTMAKAAILFGFSRPNPPIEASHMQNKPMSNISNYNLKDNSVKLALDAYNEITIDPSAVGCSEPDSMSIVGIAKRECLIHTFSWTTANSYGDNLFVNMVTPNLAKDVTSLIYSMPPCALASVPFKYWRGSMKFRFEIVCSNFHRGRLRFVFDPRAGGAELSNTNVSYTQIVDISEERNVEMCVGWASQTPYLLVGKLRDNAPGLSGFFDPTHHNGQVSVKVEMPLVTPDGFQAVSSTVNILVYACMCDDFEVNFPTENSVGAYSYLKEQSGVMSDAPLIMDPDNACLNMAEEMPSHEKMALLYFGERIVSFRQLIKRYTFLTCYDVNIDVQEPATIGQGTLYYPPFPPYPGIVDGWTIAVRVRNTFLNWITPCYLAKRGSIRWKAMLTSDVGGGGADWFSASLLPNYDVDNPVTLDVLASDADNAINYFESGMSGSVMNMPHLNPAIEIEVPYYDFRRFQFAQHKNPGRRDLLENAPHTNRVVYKFGGWGASGSKKMMVNLFVAAGEDYSLTFWKYTPLFYDTPPLP